ncbi:alpha-mannosidase [Gracilibacillus alcaliphilus]|uniref:alpha-mannosidase n=1 Tax=Gracilibacillus alcaliphilus TaxID=1401441 RepID=UPI00195D6491|nr:alpha-mannosidase [Gracilibacillus alcaliphilus]MBM7676288.1 alpha-mannosidase [Gracilibacillus alcaliphilus]
MQHTQQKTVHIISHTHWDREWYLPYEKHHFLLVKFMDELIDTLENDPNYKSFHLDGQTIILDDYLQVRPEKREQIKRLIEADRIHVGPWYILQDEFLTSSEANIRNLQYGMKDAKKWGNISKIGYFPDSFGNMGQAPQILKQAGIRHAAYGRGVKPTGFNNLVSEADMYESPYSEMKWQSPDGSEVTGILFANWYCNGNEVPTEIEAAKKYWDGHLEAMEKYASSNHMLMLNGCDHQPVQTDLSKAIETAQALYPEIQFVHSNFNDYTAALDAELDQERLKTVDGELRSQHTDGWGTLVNTASARVYLKQMNQEVQTLLESELEPLAVFAYLVGEEYDHDILEYAWKTLMQNHPHDSICGCSVDEVHREMATRFEKSKHMSESLKKDVLAKLTKRIDTSAFKQYGDNPVPLAVFNTTGHQRTSMTTLQVDLERQYYADGVHRKKLVDKKIDSFKLVDNEGNIVPSTIEDKGVVFDYDLPKHQFRQPYLARRVEVSFEAVDMPAFSHRAYALVETEVETTEESLIASGENVLENQWIKAEIQPNGSLSILNKTTNQSFDRVLVYEDTGDIGNEYMYKQANEDLAITTEDLQADIRLLENGSHRAAYEIVHQLEIPESADDTLEQEQQAVVWFTNRKAKRSNRTTLLTIYTQVSLTKHDKGIEVEVHYHNTAKDHRLRVLFPTNIQSDYHYADSIFEVAKRVNVPAAEWTNPDHSQHQQAFVSMHDEHKGLTIANKGLNEYEILRDNQNTIAVTLLRAVGEMGDWGYFPTPEAQCLGAQTASFKIFPHLANDTCYEVYQQAYLYQVPLAAFPIPEQTGELAAEHTYVSINLPNQVAWTSLKVSDDSNDVYLRMFNMSDQPRSALVTIDQATEAYQSNVIEEKIGSIENEIKIAPYEITTTAWKL